jgi:hypothetical protein
MSVETVERGGTTLFQFRVSGPDVGRNQVPGLDRPVFIPYIFDHVESTAERATGPIAVVETVSGLMRRGEVPVSPIVVFLVTRPGKRIRTWVEGLDRDLGTAERELLTKRTGEIAADDVERLDAVGIVFPRSGQPINAFDLPMPSEWSAAMMLAGRPLPVPDLLQIVWPDTRAP